MTGGGGYALDLGSPVSHVAASLDRAAPVALSVGEMAADYRHVNHSDLARIRMHEGCASDAEATQWLIRRAVGELTRRGKNGQVQIAEDDGRFRLIVPFSEVKWGRRPVYALHPDIHAEFGDPFNPNSGRWSDNIRTDPVAAAKDNMEELRESMRALGWVPEFPALRDRKRGIYLTGHRRLKVAEELRAEGLVITDQVKDLDIGDGDEHDARRLAIALASNIGFKPMSPTDRKFIAESLYSDGWTMARIGQALNVSQKTISKDLEGVYTQGINRPKGGRPRKSDDPALLADVRPYVESGQRIPMKEMQAKHDTGKNTITRAAEQVRGTLAEANHHEPADVPSWQMMAELFRRLPEDDKTSFLTAIGVSS